MNFSSFKIALWTLVKPYYIDQNRFYHTMDHIDAMLSGYETHFGDISIEEYIAILYHDAIHDTFSDLNEENSAALIEQDYPKYFKTLKRETVDKAKVLVLSTKHLGGAIINNPDALRIVDLDLMILGRSQDVYDSYVSNTRKEYSVYSDRQWQLGRTKALNHFLAQPRIFQTPEMYQIYEQAARANITRELLELA